MGTGRRFQARRRDSEELPVEVAIGPVAGGAYAVAIVRDVSASARIEDELRENEARFRIAAFASADALNYVNVATDSYIWFGDIDGMMGYADGEFPRTFSGWLEQIHPDDLDRIEAAVESIIDNDEPGWSFRYRMRTKDGNYRHILDRGTVTEHLDGRPNAGMGALVDETDAVTAREELEEALRQITELKQRLEAEGEYLRDEIRSGHNFEEIVGDSAELLATLEQLDRVAETNATVLLLGETGTGKELLARATHARSKRSERPLIKVDCTTLPSGLIESELFGHEKGSFTGAHESKAGRFELADGGTIFLDEVGELPIELQPKLLRVIQEGELQRLGGKTVKKVDVRVIAATHRNLREEVRAGRFRADLYYRLSVFPVEIPALRDRREDIPALARFFVTQRGKALGTQVERIPPRTMEQLTAYDWPGNIRELQNVIERAIILSSGPDLALAEPLVPTGSQPPKATGVLRTDLDRLERQRILDALQASDWKIKGEGNAASLLGLKPSTLRSRMKRLGVERH
jgi:transcriptional regulator with PAS, ATPase and Fis domain